MSRAQPRVTDTDAQCLPASSKVNPLNCDIFDDSSHCFVSHGRHATPLTTVDHVLVTVNRQATTGEQKTCGDKPRSFPKLHLYPQPAFRRRLHTESRLTRRQSSVARLCHIGRPPNRYILSTTNTCHFFSPEEIQKRDICLT